MGRPGAHNFQCFRCPQTVPYFPAPTSAPGSLEATKPPPEVPNCVPGSLTYPLDAVVMIDGRLGGLCLPPWLLQISRQQIVEPGKKRIQEAVPMGRGARDAYRRVPRGALGSRWSLGTNLG